MFEKLTDFFKGKQLESEPKTTNQIATDYSDGAYQYEGFDSVNNFIMNFDFKYSNQADLIDNYREIASYNEVDYAIEDIVNECVSFSEEENVIDLDLEQVDLSATIKDKINKAWDKIYNILDLNATVHQRLRTFYVDGRGAYQKVVDSKKLNKGLLNIIELDSRFVSKVRNVIYDKENQTISKVEEYFVYDEEIQNKGTSDTKQKAGQYKQPLRLTKESITYFTSGLIDNKTGYAISWLHKAVKPANQLRMMENALVIYRITRAPERRIFYVDVGKQSPQKAKQTLNQLKNNYRNRMSYDPENGSFKDTRHLMTMQEDYWLPRDSSGRGTEVSTLPGGCLAMDTKVSLLDGRELSIKDIELELNAGKTVWTYSVDPETGKIVPGLISWAGVTQKSADVMKLTLDNGEEIICTPDHQFPVNDKGFVRADELIENESMMALHRKKEFIGKNKKLDYEQFFDSESKNWKYTHRVVADYLKDHEVFNYIYESNEEESFDVRHHIDCDRFNNDPSNLCFMSWVDHQKLHSDLGFSKEASALGTKAAKERLEYLKEFEPEEYKKRSENISERTKKFWAGLSDDEYDEITNKQSDGVSRYISQLSPEQRKLRNIKSKEYLAKGAKIVAEKRKNDPEYAEWFSSRQSAGWTDEARQQKSQLKSKHNKEVLWGDLREETLAKHREMQKVNFSHGMLLFVIDQIKGKTSHQVTVKDVCKSLNNNTVLVEELKTINANKSVPNWNVNIGFTETLVKKIPVQFGYTSWIDLRKKESVHNHRIVKIERLPEKIEVGTLTIDQDEVYHNYHTFALSCGIFTKNSNLDDIGDVLYFQKRLYKALNIPISRLETDSAISFGRQSEIGRDELKFSKFISKIRKRFNLMFLDLLKTELILTNIITVEEWETKVEHLIIFKYAQDLYLEEQKKFELLRDRLDLMKDFEEHVGKYVSHDYIRSTILGQTEEERKAQDELILQEKQSNQYQPDEM